MEKVAGKSNTEAVMQSYDVTSRESAKVMGSQLMQKPEIQISITKLMDYYGIDKPYRIRRLKQIIDAKDLNIAHKGLEMSFKLDGSYSPEKVEHLIYDPLKLYEVHQELETFIQKLKAEVSKRKVLLEAKVIDAEVSEGKGG